MLDSTNLKEELKEQQVDIIVSSSKENVFYSTGIKFSLQWHLDKECFCIWSVEDGGPYLIVPLVDISQVADSGLNYEEVYTYSNHNLFSSDNLSDVDNRLKKLYDTTKIADEPLDALLKVLDGLIDPGDTVALEQRDFLPEEVTQLSDNLDVNGITEASSIFRNIQKIKGAEEIKRSREAAKITEEALEETVKKIQPGITEQELAKIHKQKMIEKGATETLQSVVGFGDFSARQHNIPYEEYGVKETRSLQKGDLIRFDVGCLYKGYPSDIARTYAFGQVSEETKSIYRIIYNGNEKAISLLEHGADTYSIYTETRDFIQKEAMKEGVEQLENYDRRHFGHGNGIHIYDPPIIGPERNTLQSGMVMSVETPYLELGRGGLQVEDEVLIKEGGIDRFTHSPKSLPIIE